MENSRPTRANNELPATADMLREFRELAHYRSNVGFETVEPFGDVFESLFDTVHSCPQRVGEVHNRVADLGRLVSGHAAAFAKELAFDLARKPRLDSLWVNLLRPGGHHSAHIHLHSILSGTFYVEVPPGSGEIRFEDPRLPMMMASPMRREDAPGDLRPFLSLAPRPGLLLMWESWLRHEVMPGNARAERLSISFNFA